MKQVDNTEPSPRKGKGVETKICRSDSTNERPATKKRIPWNKGLTKETHLSLRKVSEKVSGAQNGAYGKSAWNKGLTKELDLRVAKYGRSRSRSYRAGKWEAWNKGLTKETHPGIRSQARKMKGKLAGDKHPTKRPEVRRKISEAAVRRTQRADWHPYSRGGYREDLGHYVRSSWEANFARLLKFLEVEYEYEAYSFPIGNSIHYLPDFYLIPCNRFAEVKGNGSSKKFLRFLELYDVAIDLVNEPVYKQLRSKFKDFIPNWEHDL